MLLTIRPHRLFVSGGSDLSSRAALLWRKLGAKLADRDGLVVITGGLAGRHGREDRTADYEVIKGMTPHLSRRQIPADDRIETVLPDPRIETRQA